MGSKLTWTGVVAWRLQRQGLAGRVPADRLLQVVAGICGLHAQLGSSAELALWARVEGVTSRTLAAALWDDRTLVKTWAMRGTLHLLPASEYRLWQAGLSTYDHYLKASWRRYFGVTEDQLEELVGAVGELLKGRVLTREELAAAVGEATGDPELGDKLRESWGALLKPASFRGRLCFGPSRGRNVCFTHPDTWLGEQAAVQPAAALEEITRRFLAANGPATREDYARWWAVSPAKAQARIRSLGDEVAEVDVEGTACWMPADRVEEAASAEPPKRVNLLPAFDPYVIAATRHAESLMPGPFKARIYRPQGWISPVLLLDGRMDGVWSHQRQGDRLTVKVEPFTELPGWAAAQVAEEAQRLAGFTGCGDVELSIDRL